MGRVINTVLFYAWLLLFVESQASNFNRWSDTGSNGRPGNNAQWGSNQQLNKNWPLPDDFMSSFSSENMQMSNTNSNNNVMQNCQNGVCQTCVNNRCYKGTYTQMFQYGQCSPAVCVANCVGMVLNTDQCPICRCKGFSTRELCETNNDCKLNSGKCQEGVCRYPPVSDSLPKMCSFAYECKETEDCVQSVCRQDQSGGRHLLARSCVFLHDCPSGYNCDKMTCWQSNNIQSPVPGGRQVQTHIEGNTCVFTYECPTLYECQNMSCVYTGKQHGGQCIFPTDCSQTQSCIQMTCQ